MEATIAFLLETVLPFLEQNGVVFSALLAAIAFAFKTRLEVKQSLRHTLFLVMQVRLALSSYSDDIKGSVSKSVDSVMGDLGGLGVPIDDESLEVNRAEAEQFGAALEDRFFALDGMSFSDSIRNATRELSKSDPFMANKITFISKLPSVLESQKAYILKIEEVSAGLSDESLPPHVRENTRLVCKRLLEKQNAKVIGELLSEVDSTLIELAKRSSLFHWWKIKRLLARWESENPEDFMQPDSGDLEKMLYEAVGEIQILNEQHEEAASNSAKAHHA